jgi:hypothetical protein
MKEEIVNACDYLPAPARFETSIGNSPRVKVFRGCQKSLIAGCGLLVRGGKPREHRTTRSELHHRLMEV